MSADVPVFRICISARGVVHVAVHVNCGIHARVGDTCHTTNTCVAAHCRRGHSTRGVCCCGEEGCYHGLGHVLESSHRSVGDHLTFCTEYHVLVVRVFELLAIARVVINCCILRVSGNPNYSHSQFWCSLLSSDRRFSAKCVLHYT